MVPEYFATVGDMETYLNNEAYEATDEYAGLCFAIDIAKEEGSSKYTISIYGADVVGERFSNLPYQFNEAADPNTKVPEGGAEIYATRGYM